VNSLIIREIKKDIHYLGNPPSYSNNPELIAISFEKRDLKRALE